MPDYEIRNLWINDITPTPGQTITVSYEIWNVGSGSDHFFINDGFLSSTNATYEAGEELSTNSTVSGFFPTNNYYAVSYEFFVPTYYTAGSTYWLGAVADYIGSVSETREDNNQRSQLITIASNTPSSAGTVSISDVSVFEGNTGSILATFTVTRSGGTAAFSVSYDTSNGTATLADSDYFGTFGTLFFAENDNTETITVEVRGDTLNEIDETFFVDLFGATSGATISDGSATGFIWNDDFATPSAGTLAISDVTVFEGNTGSTLATFTVTRSGGTAAFSVSYDTSDGTATNLVPSDYIGTSGTLFFAENDNTETITVEVRGDTLVEGDETFFADLLGATAGAIISDASATALIRNDDFTTTTPIANLDVLIEASAIVYTSRQVNNEPQFEALTAAYVYLGFGVPTISGYTFLINSNNTTNFGAGIGVVFNDENIFINAMNALYQGNSTASATFNSLVAGSISLSGKLELVYDSVVPLGDQSVAGRAYFVSQAGFYAARATELHIPGETGAALVGAAALIKITVTSNIGGIGDAINDLRSAINNGTAIIPEIGGFTPIETADGTMFDGGDDGVGADDYADSLADSTAPRGFVLVGSTATGRIETTGDADIFSINLTAGQTYTFNLDGDTLGDPFLRLLDLSGTVLAINDDFNGLNSQITFTATTTGTHYLQASGFGSSTGGYSLDAHASAFLFSHGASYFVDADSDAAMKYAASPDSVPLVGTLELTIDELLVV